MARELTNSSISVEAPAAAEQRQKAGVDHAQPFRARAERWVRSGLLRPQLGILCLYLALAIAFFWGALSSPTGTWIGVNNEPVIVLFFLKWVPFAVVHGHSPLVTNYLDYPNGTNVMWNTAMLLPAIVLWPLTKAFGVVLSYNVLVTIACALNCWFAYLAIRRFTPTHLGPAVGGLVYGFSPYMISQFIGHIQTSFALFPPLIVIALHEILVTQRRRPLFMGVVLGLLCGAQFLTGEEVFTSTLVVTVIALALLALKIHEKARLEHAAVAVVTAAVITAAIAVYPLVVQFLGPQTIHGAFSPPNLYSTDLASLVAPSSLQHFNSAGSLALTGRLNSETASAYVGLPLLVLLPIAVLVTWKDHAARYATVLGVVVVILSFGATLEFKGRLTGIPLPWRVIGNGPVFKDLIPARLWLYVWFLIAVVLALYIARVMTVRVIWRIGGLAILGLALIPLFPRTPFPSTRAETPPFFTSAETARIPVGSVALVNPFAHNQASTAMLWQVQSGMRFRMPEGFVINPRPKNRFSFSPPPTTIGNILISLDNGAPEPALTPRLKRAILSDLSHLHVRTIISGPSHGEGAVVSMFTGVLGRPPDHVGGVNVWWNVPVLSARGPGRAFLHAGLRNEG